MSNRTISILGVIVSGLGVIVSIITIVFTQYKIASLISLFVVEVFVIVIWLYYAKQKNKVLYPYEYEIKFRSLRYVFESEDKMCFECTEVLRITHPNVPHKQVRHFWSGRGNITLETPLIPQEPGKHVNGETGEISFNYPTLPASRFGDTVVVRYALHLEDMTGHNRPELYTRIKYPTDLLVMEVILTYKDNSGPASFGHRPVEDDPAAFLPYQNLIDLPFDTKLKSFRRVIPKPTLHHKYQIKWEK
jgi:hypothetical protein